MKKQIIKNILTSIRNLLQKEDNIRKSLEDTFGVYGEVDIIGKEISILMETVVMLLGKNKYEFEQETGYFVDIICDYFIIEEKTDIDELYKLLKN